MKKIEDQIYLLFYDHDCVVIPHFGGFVCNYKSAFIHSQSKLIYPPSKAVSFNKNLVQNDGLLAQFLSSRLNISYSEALEMVEKSVENYNQLLKNGQRVDFKHVGMLHLGNEDEVLFTAHQSKNFLKSSFGLTPVMTGLVEQVEVPVAPKVVVMETPKEEQAPETPTKSNNFKRIVAAAVLVPAFMIFGYSVGKQSTGDNELSMPSLKFWDTDKTIESTYTPRIEGETLELTKGDSKELIASLQNAHPDKETLTYSFENDEVSSDGITLTIHENEVVSAASETEEIAVEKVEPVKTVEEKVVAKEVKNSSNNLGLYFIVGGAFADQSNAEKFVKQLKSKGYDASIFDKKGDLHMVCYGSFSNADSAKTAMEEIKARENVKAWLKRP